MTYDQQVIASLAFLSVVFALIGIMIMLVRILRRPPEIIQQPERCASCGGVLPKGEHPVEFTGVPVAGLFGKELVVHFKTCQSCVAIA